MQFRYRKPYDDEVKAYEQGEREYEAHLTARKPKLVERDLWRFFGYDFFHDGEIESIGISNDFRGVDIRIDCPNIKVRKAGEDFEYISGGFTCHFRGVDLFQIDSEEEDLSDAVFTVGGGQYKYAEVDTLAERMAAASKRWREEDEASGQSEEPEFHSLIIMTDKPFNISIVFQSLDVEPDEPAAFELMLRNPDFIVPIRGEE